MGKSKRCRRTLMDHRTSWQLLLDQYDWYVKNGYCMVDVMARMVIRDAPGGSSPHAANVLRYLKRLDDSIACGLGLLCLRPIWIPSPEQRVQDLENRLAIVSSIADGRYVLSRPMEK